MNPNPLLSSPLIPFVLMALVMYFILLRPQMKQQKDLTRMQGNLKKNDEVVTYGGIYGTVVNLKEQTVTLRVDDNVRLEVDKTAIVRRVKEG